MVTDPSNYPWLSYQVNALRKFNSVLTPHPDYLALGANDADRPKRPVNHKTVVCPLFAPKLMNRAINSPRSLPYWSCHWVCRYGNSSDPTAGRCAAIPPSSGNLHPTEGYVIATAIDGIENGVYHYAPHEHALELRGIAKNSAAAPQLLIGLSSIMWRESWKYGERAFRYVQLDTGHALGAIRYAAEVMGLQVNLLDVSDDKISYLLGIDRDMDFTNAEKEHPDLLLQIHINKEARPVIFPVIDAWNGSANPLGRSPHPQWEIIDKVAAATRCDSPMKMKHPRSAFPEPLLSFDKKTAIKDFFWKKIKA